MDCLSQRDRQDVKLHINTLHTTHEGRDTFEIKQKKDLCGSAAGSDVRIIHAE